MLLGARETHREKKAQRARIPWTLCGLAFENASNSALSAENLSVLTGPFFRSTWVSRCLLKQRMMEVVVTAGLLEL